jgi:tetratricopeptide (TPR) repeat protein
MPVLLRNPLGRLMALATCVGLAWASFVPATALAATFAAPPGESSANADAEVMFRRGQAKYETADYAGAIDLWTEAYALVESTPETASIKALLLYNLAQAHVKAYELDEDAIHLKQAQQLLSSFRNNLTLLYEDKAQLEEETKKVDERLAEIEVMLAAAKPTQDEPPPPELESPPPEDEPEPVVDDSASDARPGKPLMIAGGVMLGLGVGGAVIGIVGAALGSGANDIGDLDATDLAAREQRFATGRTGNALLIVGSVTAGVLLPVGGALMAIGAKRNNEAKRSTAILQRTRLGASFGGTWGKGGGLAISGRF